jgi:hypothetical protein
MSVTMVNETVTITRENDSAVFNMLSGILLATLQKRVVETADKCKFSRFLP